MDEEKIEQAMRYAHDTGFDEGYQVGWEDGYAVGVAESGTYQEIDTDVQRLPRSTQLPSQDGREGR